MKSTYKLIGLFLDHGEIPLVQPEFADSDLENSIKVKLSTLLSLNELKTLESKNNNAVIQILIDYVPDTSNEVVMAFFVKRVLQIFERLRLIGRRCSFAEYLSEKEKYAKFGNHIRGFYEKKARNTVGAALRADG